jgi:chromosome segregation ATPase
MEAGKSYREDDYLKKGEAQVYQLQQQVDELRRLLREQVSRQHLVEENWKQAEARIIQLTEQQSKQAAEHAQNVQVRSLEEHRIKQDVAELQVRVNEPIKPIRDLRAQLQEVLEARRRDNEQVALDKSSLDKLSASIRDLQAQFTRYDAIAKDLRESVKITANAQEFYQRELDRLIDVQRSLEQVIRRQSEEFRQEIKSVRSEVQLFTNRITRLEELQRQDTAKIDEIPPQLEVLRTEDERAFANLTRVEKTMSERFVVAQNRLEEIRQQIETQFFNVNQLVVGQVESAATRFTQVDDRLRVLDATLINLQLRIEQVKQVGDAEIFDIYQIYEAQTSRYLEFMQAEFDLVRQQRTKSGAGAVIGRRGMRRAKPKSEQTGEGGELDEALPPSYEDDASI